MTPDNNFDEDSRLDEKAPSSQFQLLSEDSKKKQNNTLGGEGSSGLVSPEYYELQNNKSFDRVRSFSNDMKRAVQDSLSFQSYEKYSDVDKLQQEQEKKTAVLQVLYLSFFAILGTLLRILLAQLFGEECKNPGTVGWLKSENALCITGDGSTTREGGIIFSDIPSNMLGSFLMGLFLSGSALGIPVDIPFGIAPVGSPFQSWKHVHLAMRTGFCGSLTTFSSWNSEMVVMIFGTGSNYQTQWIKAMFGYVVGLELAISSFNFGKNMALIINRITNPNVAHEIDVLNANIDICVNTALPGFERRFLGGVMSLEELENANPILLEELKAWKNSTDGHRRKESELHLVLQDIEKLVLVHNEDPMLSYSDILIENGWNLKALQRWKTGKDNEIAAKPQQKPWDAERLAVILPILIIVIAMLVLGLSLEKGNSKYSKTYRTMWYSALLAPFGAILRWRLSKLNGQLDGSLSWLPAGTLTANVLGSIISITMIATELDNASMSQSYFRGYGTLTAIKIGFAGSLSTVSTFVNEITTLMKGFPQNKHAYQYMFISLFLSCFTGILAYGWIIFF